MQPHVAHLLETILLISSLAFALIYLVAHNLRNHIMKDHGSVPSASLDLAQIFSAVFFVLSLVGLVACIVSE